MKKLFIMAALVVLVFAQEPITKLKVNRKTESILATLFEELPQRVDVFITLDSTYIVEAIYPNQKMVVKLTSLEYRDLLSIEPPKITTLENARVSYLIGQTALGLGLYSWAVPVALALEDKNAAAIGLFTPLLYASTHYLLTSGRRISGGSAFGAFMGDMEGGVHGGLLFESARGILPLSLCENILDNVLGQTMAFTPAMYQRKFNHCAYGYYHYFAFWTLVRDWDDWNDEDNIEQIGTVFSLGEGYTSLFFPKNSDDLTFGDALFELLTGIMGAEFMPLILATFDLHREEQTDEKIYAVTSLLGHGLGYVWGRKMTRRYDLPGTAGVLMWILPYLAHGATAGLVVLTESEGFAKSYPAIFLTMDLALTYVCYTTFAEKATKTGNAHAPKLNIAVNPVCFMLKDKVGCKIPFLMVSYNF